MTGGDRLLSPRTLLQVGGILLAASALAFAANGLRSEKQVEIGKQYFRAAVLAEQARASGSTAGTAPPAPPPALPANGAAAADGRSSAPAPSPQNPTAAAPPATEVPAPPAPPPTPTPEDEPPVDGLQRISLEDCRDLIGSPVAVFVDARDRDFYLAGHIPGAVHLYHYESAKHIDEVRPILQEAFMVIVYCNGGDCEDSINLALDLVGSYGLPNENVHVFEGGMDVWKAAGLPVVVGESRE